MFPIRDTIRSRTFPVATYGLIAINVITFLFESALSPARFNDFLGTFGMVPANFSPLQPLGLITLFTSIFLHGSWFHLISNMWTLVIFGDNVEDRMGSVRYVFFYLLSGLAAGIAHILATILFSGVNSIDAQIPTVGASGAIAGVLGAYFILYPRARVVTLIPLFILPYFVEIPAFIYLGIWLFTQVSSGLLSLGAYGAFGGIAWFAHIGGFLVGLLLVRFFARRRDVYRNWYPDDYQPG